MPSKPICPKCKTNENVVRLWQGRERPWVCRIHLKIGNTQTTPQSFRDRLLHRIKEQETLSLIDVLPNRAARRAHRGWGGRVKQAA